MVEMTILLITTLGFVFLVLGKLSGLDYGIIECYLKLIQKIQTLFVTKEVYYKEQLIGKKPINQVGYPRNDLMGIRHMRKYSDLTYHAYYFSLNLNNYFLFLCFKLFLMILERISKQKRSNTFPHILP